MNFEPILTPGELENYLKEIFPQAGVGADWTIDAITPGKAAILFKTNDANLRPGGTVSGPTLFTLADIGAYIVILSHIGKVPLAVTTNLNINFLAKPLPGELLAEAQLVKLGKRLAVAEIHIYNRIDGKLEDQMVAQASATYSIPPR